MNRHALGLHAIPPSLTGLAGIVLILHPFLTGCGNERPVHADTLETRVTTGAGTKHYPRFSPDGTTLAYSMKEGPGQIGGWAVRFCSAEGGEPREVSPAASSRYAIDWSADGRAILAYDDSTSTLCRLAIDGTVEEWYGKVENGHVEDASEDGERFLAFRFTGKSYDVGIVNREPEAAFTPLAETPGWELYGSFGPGPGEVTVCRFGNYSDPVSEVVVWSPTDRAFTPLSLPRARNSTPSWSRDGRYLAWISNASGNMDVWLYERATGRSVQATRTPEDENAPHWSPDGDRIAFSRESRSSHLFLADLRDRTTRPLTEGPDRDTNPARSQDGAWVVFSRRSASELTGKIDLCVVSVETGQVQSLELGRLTPHAGRHIASWSPDASELAFAAEDPSGNVDIYRIHREGGTPLRVTIAPGVDAQPAWSPDGSTIAYLRVNEGESQIYTIPASGGIPRPLVTEDGVNEGLLWSPDSEALAFYRVLGMERFELWVASARRPGELRRVLGADQTHWPHRWTPDAEELIVAGVEGKQYVFDAVSLDGTRRVRIGSEPVDPKDRPFLAFTPEGRAYSDVLFPGGRLIYADGETSSDLYILQVKDVLAGKHVF